MKRILPVILSVLILSSCNLFKKQIDISPISTDTLKEVHFMHDTLIIHDSAYIEKLGDTVNRYLYKYIYKVSSKTDTVYESKVDSVIVENEKIVEKKVKYVPLYAKISSILGFIIIIVSGITLYLKIKKN